METLGLLAVVAVALVLAYYMGKDQARFERESEYLKQERERNHHGR